MTTQTWAASLVDAHRQNQIKPVWPAAAEATEPNAYAVQSEVIRALSNNNPIVGFKGALTNEAGQKAMGWQSPMGGVLLANMEQPTDQAVDPSLFHSGVIETEIGFLIGKDINEPVTPTSLSDYLEAALPMIELGDVGFNQRPTPLDLIAGNAAAKKFIRGAPTSYENINAAQVTLSNHDGQLHEGRATDAFGDLYAAGAWLVNHCLERSLNVKAGHVLMTGSLGQIQPLRPGNYVADYGAIGTIEFSVQS